MFHRQKLFFLSTLFFFASSAHAVPPGTVICDNPTVQPDVIIRWGPISTDLVNVLVFDSTHVFTSAGPYGAINRLALNGENLESWHVTDLEWPSWMAICPTTGQLYVNDFNWPNPGGFDHRLWVFDPDGNGTPANILFTGQSSKAPGGIVDGPLLFEFHPTTGALYVLDEGWYVDAGDSTWVSRIQRFSPNGSYDGFKIDNALGHPPDPTFELPDCGVWRFPHRFFIDNDGNIYLVDNGWNTGDVPAVQRFNSAGACTDVWDLNQFDCQRSIQNRPVRVTS